MVVKQISSLLSFSLFFSVGSSWRYHWFSFFTGEGGEYLEISAFYMYKAYVSIKHDMLFEMTSLFIFLEFFASKDYSIWRIWHDFLFAISSKRWISFFVEDFLHRFSIKLLACSKDICLSFHAQSINIVYEYTLRKK